MISYNFDVLCELFNSLSELMKTNICVYDNNFECAHVENAKSVAFCTTIHDSIQPKCAASDAGALTECLKNGKPINYHCHFGFIEMMIPYTINQTTTIYVSIGPFRDPEMDAEMEQKIEDYCRLLHLDRSSSIASYRNTPEFTMEKYHAILNLADTIIEYAKTEKLITIKENFLETDLNPYLEKHVSENILISDIASHFYYTNKQFEGLVLQYSGMTPKKYILNYKMNVAKQMLITTNDSLQSIAYKVGFEDYNYFIKVFKQVYRETPLNYRKKFATKTYQQNK